jgi:hypothetical protein
MLNCLILGDWFKLCLVMKAICALIKPTVSPDIMYSTENLSAEFHEHASIYQN